MNPSRKNRFVTLLAAGLCSVATVCSALTPGGTTTVRLDSGGTAVVNLTGLRYKTQYTFAATDACCGASNTVAALDVRVDLFQKVTDGTTASIDDYPLAEGEMEDGEDGQFFRTYVEAWPASFGCGTLTVKAARLLISGDPFDQVTVSSKVGICKPLAPEGSRENPKLLPIPGTWADSFLKTGTNWFTCVLGESQWYRFTWSGGGQIVLEEGVAANSALGDTTLLFRSLVAGPVTNCLLKTGATNQFSLKLEKIASEYPIRLPAEHAPSTNLDDNAAFDDPHNPLVYRDLPVEAVTMPNSRVYYDDIIDSGLLRFNNMKNTRHYDFTCQFIAPTNWVESGSNGVTVSHAISYDPFPVLIQVYDAMGATCWQTNVVMTITNHQDVAFGFSPPNSADYWIGAAQINARLVDANGTYVLNGSYSNVTCRLWVTVTNSPSPSAGEGSSEITYVYDAADGVYAAAIGNGGVAVKGGDLALGDDGVYRVTVSSLNGLELRLSELAGTGPYRLVSGQWPSGFKFDAQTGRVTGIATVPGIYAVTVAASDGTLVALSLEVAEGVAEPGSYSGVVSGGARTPAQWAASPETAGAPQYDYASVAVAVTAAGKLTAKATVGGKTYSFAATGFAYDAKEKQTYALFRKTVKISGVGYEDELRIRLTDSAPVRGDVQLLRVHLAPGNGGSVLEGRYATDPDCLELAGGPDGSKPDCALVRQNAPGASVPSYYTMALLCPAEALAKRGAGWLTVRVDAKGGVKIIGAFPNGKSVSASGLANVQGDGAGEPCVVLPLCVSSGTGVLAGFVRLAPDAQTGKWAADGVFRWNSVDPADVLTGEARMELLKPVGGAYAPAANVQEALQTDALAAHIEEEGIFDAGLQDGETGISFPEAFQVGVAKTGFSTSARRLVRDGENSGRIDWENSVNPFNFKLRLKPATGVLSGSVDVWYREAGAAKEKSKSAKLTGVLLQTQRSDDPWPLTGVGTVSLTAPKGKPLPTGLLTLE